MYVSNKKERVKYKSTCYILKYLLHQKNVQNTKVRATYNSTCYIVLLYSTRVAQHFLQFIQCEPTLLSIDKTKKKVITQPYLIKNYH